MYVCMCVCIYVCMYVYVCMLIHCYIYKLKCCNKGNKIFRQFLGAIMYADDLLLILSSIVNFLLMTNICTKYMYIGLIMGITFDHVMSNCLAIYHTLVIFLFLH